MTSSPTIEVHGPAIREIRKRTGLGQGDIATSVGVTRPYIVRIETGSSPRVSPQVFAALASALGLEDKRAIMARPYGSDLDAA